MFSKIVFLIALLSIAENLPEYKKIYHKEHYSTGSLKLEGWLKDGNKSGYWKFYHTNGKVAEQGLYEADERDGYWYFYDLEGNLQQEGHYKKGFKSNWWLFYDGNGKINHKCQLNNGKKNGYCLKYMDEKLTSAEKYKDGKKIKEWYSFASFKRENKLSDLK